MSDSSSICLSCLQCCSGTLIGFVQLEHEEVSRLRDVLDIEDDSNEAGIFLQPCKSLSADGCVIYDKRPKQCAKFNCALLTSVEQKETNFDSAIKIINTVKQKRIDIEAKLALLDFNLKSESFYFKMVELKKVLKRMEAVIPLTQSQIALKIDIDQLDIILPDKFGISAF